MRTHRIFSFFTRLHKSSQTMFLKDYVLNKERLKLFYTSNEKLCKDELNQKYNSYFQEKLIT